jgi:anti-sigma factor RsiW
MTTAPHDTQLIGAYVLGTLDPDERRDIETHIASCAACRAELIELEAVKDVLDELPPEALLHGPPDADLVLQRTLRQMRSETTKTHRRGWTAVGAAAAIVLAGALAGGVAIGRGTTPSGAPVAQPSVSAPAAVPGTRVGTTLDARTNTRITASVVPAAGWVRVNASVSGIPRGQNCRLIVVGRNNPQGEIAGGWIVSAAGEQNGTNLDGTAAIPPDEVVAIKVVNTAGETFVTLNL